MKNYIVKTVLLLFLSASIFSCKTGQTALEGLSFKEQLKVLFPSAKISAIQVNDHFKEAYQLILKQPLDHDNPLKGTFDHYVYVSHSGYAQPTVLVTEGYSAKHKTYELSSILKSNQVMVEYRFYGKSRPNPIPWDYLKNDQAIEDYHTIVNKLKRLYKNKWISTGISKGGETVLIYKSKYPKDVDVVVPYVAPLINTQEDIRTTQLINTVGTKDCRKKIVGFQRLVLKNREEVLKEMRSFVEEKSMNFTEVGIEEALEYAVLEFPFSFWQWGGICEGIPNDSVSAKELFNYLNKVIPISFYNDETYYDLLPSYYQHMVELGYYGFDFSPVSDLLKMVKSTSNKRFAPKNVDLTYDAEYIKTVRSYVENKGSRILYIYGANDPWGACAPNPKTNIDALKMVLKEGDHRTRIKHFSKEDQQKIYAKLQSWLGENIQLAPLKTE
ncbi:S28 family serine protease [Snuella sedimenti]|uniref:PS-10 peptidase S37 n=1 Tax=Snuella sedimenti TaxID=2798802 RepID=A0A8J7IGL1_9FLAO|nr:S28 family serine protease [Snuella sedimenti]MBJ6367728.1 hypothetical protein [Snuella sedimenti]